ncbi:MAG: ABC transporter permease [Spirochaetales bacterium]|nr:ABC transporter permease [Spirochaetales bacterium]
MAEQTTTSVAVEPAGRTRGLPPIVWPLLALAAILLFNLILTEGFFSIVVKDGHLFGSLIDILKRAAPTLIIALGMTLVIATGGIDISVGSVAAIAGSVGALMIRGTNIAYLEEAAHATAPLLPVFAFALLAAAAAGLFNGVLVSIVGIQPIVATLILMITGRGVAMLVTGGYVLSFDHPRFEYVGIGHLLGLPFPFIMAVGVFVVLFLLTRLIPLGLFVQATGGNTTASTYSGVNTRIVKLLVYLVSGICAGIAGLILTSDVKAADANYMGLWLELDAILAVVIGGTAMTGGRYSLWGTIVGALIIQTLTTTILTRGVQVQLTLIVKAVVVVLVILIQSERTREFLQRPRRRLRASG